MTQAPCIQCGGTGQVDEVANFLLLRMRDDRHASYQWVGVSSTAMIVAALTGEDPEDHPYDGWDLGRCMVTRDVAPESLRPAMDKIIRRWCKRMRDEWRPHHGVEDARKMRKECTPVVRARLEALAQ